MPFEGRGREKVVPPPLVIGFAGVSENWKEFDGWCLLLWYVVALISLHNSLKARPSRVVECLLLFFFLAKASGIWRLRFAFLATLPKPRYSPQKVAILTMKTWYYLLRNYRFSHFLLRLDCVKRKFDSVSLLIGFGAKCEKSFSLLSFLVSRFSALTK